MSSPSGGVIAKGKLPKKFETPAMINQRRQINGAKANRGKRPDRNPDKDNGTKLQQDVLGFGQFLVKALQAKADLADPRGPHKGQKGQTKSQQDYQADYDALEEQGDAALEGIYLRRMINRSEYRNVRFMGFTSDVYTGKPTANMDVSTAITDITLSLANDQLSQITVTLEDPGLHLYHKRLYDKDAHIQWRGVDYMITQSQVTPGSSGLGGATLDARLSAVQQLKHTLGPLRFSNMLWSDFVAKYANEVGLGLIVEKTKVPTAIEVPELLPEQVYSEEELPSVWKAMTGGAQAEGYMLFECYGILFFCKPSWLFDQMNNVVKRWPFGRTGFFWERPETQLEKADRPRKSLPKKDVQQTIVNVQEVKKVRARTDLNLYIDTGGVLYQRLNAVPSITVSEDQAQVPVTTVDIEVPTETSLHYFVGQQFILRGMGQGIEDPRITPLLIKSIDFSMAGLGTCKITAETPVDPKPARKKVHRGDGGGGSGLISAGIIATGNYGPHGTYSYLDRAAVVNAADIYEACYKYGNGQQDAIAAICCCLVESHIHILANTNPGSEESLKYPHDGTGHNLDSVGCFQQRPSQGWGTIKHCMDPTTSTHTFLNHYHQTNKGKSIPDRVQDVQQSGPAAYHNSIANARAICAAIKRRSQFGSDSSGFGNWSPGHPIHSKSAADAVQIALTFVGKKAYSQRLGTTPPNVVPSVFDCSSLVQWCIRNIGCRDPGRNTGVQFPYWRGNNHWRANTVISIEQGFRTEGAVMCRISSGGHTGFSLGHMRGTVESQGNLGPAGPPGDLNRNSYCNPSDWDFAALIPDAIYHSGKTGRALT